MANPVADAAGVAVRVAVAAVGVTTATVSASWASTVSATDVAMIVFVRFPREHNLRALGQGKREWQKQSICVSQSFLLPFEQAEIIPALENKRPARVPGAPVRALGRTGFAMEKCRRS